MKWPTDTPNRYGAECMFVLPGGEGWSSTPIWRPGVLRDFSLRHSPRSRDPDVPREAHRTRAAGTLNQMDAKVIEQQKE